MTEYRGGTVEGDRARVEELLTAAMDAVQDSAGDHADTHQIPDPLAVLLARAGIQFGLALRPDELSIGLVRDGACLDETTLAEAGLRVGLDVAPANVQPRRIKPEHCPALAISRDGTAMLITGASDGDVTYYDAERADEERKTSLKAFGKQTVAIYTVRPLAGDVGDTSDVRPMSFWRAIVKGNSAVFAQAIAATVVVNLLGLAMPLFTMNVYDRVLPNHAVTTLVALAVGAGLATVFDFVMKTLRGLLVDTSTRHADVRLSNGLMSRILGARTDARGKPVGVQMNAVRELETLREFYTSATLTTFGDIPFALLFVAVIWLVAGPLAIVPVVAIPVVALLVIVSQLPLRGLMDRMFERMSNKSAILAETLSGLETIKGVGAESWARRRWEQGVADQLRLSGRIRFFSGLAPTIAGAGQGLTSIAAVILGVHLVNEGEISAGAVIAVVMLLSRAMGPIAQAAALAGRLHQVSVAHAALAEILAAPQEAGDASRMIRKETFDGEITFEAASFSYDPEVKPALEDISFQLAPGERVGVLGAIGSGKSTLLKLVNRLHVPTSGLCRVDGLSVSAIDPQSLRRHIGYLGQDAMLFRGTIRDNVTAHRPDVRDEQILDALRASGALAWVGGLSHGLDTELGERGAGLSGGQKRSIALARALLGEAKILLLDEPTSEMDGRTEKTVIDNLGRMLTGRTLILVTHKPATLALVDRLLVLDRGRLAANGPKQEVLQELADQNAGTSAQRTAKAA
ncbi:MAG: type I secretion system permease/ATPase [Pseudomonadota bacterium]